MKKIDEDVREFLVAQIDNVELDGLCPICGTGRSQNGECWRGHVVINVRRPTPLAADVKPRTAQEELDQLGEKLAANHAKLKAALRG